MKRPFLLSGVIAVCLLIAAATASAQSLVSAQSRKTHALGSGTFDLPIDILAPIAGAVTIESRDSGMTGHTIVFQFDIPILLAGTASVVDAGALPIGMASATVNPGNATEVLVTLTGIPDRKKVTVALDNVNGGVNHFPIAIGFRLGDTDHSATVTIADISRVKARSGQTADTGNFRFDVNASGRITAADISAVKARGNQAPIVNAGVGQTITLPAAASLVGTASDDGDPVPPGGLTFTWSRVSGPGTVVFGTPNALSTSASFTVSGNYVLRLTASDGALSSNADVSVTVNPGPASTMTELGLANPTTAGAAGTITVTVRDSFGNIATGYRGTVHVSSSDGAALLPANYAFTAGDNGVHAFAVTLNTVGLQSVTVSDVAIGALTSTQAGITVVSAALPGLFEKPHGWNKDVSAFPVSPRSAAIIAALSAPSANLPGGWGNNNKLQIDFSIAVLYADSTTPRRTITGPFDYCYGPGSPDCDPVPLQMPIPANGNTEGSADYSCPNPGDDCHVLVVERSEKKLYEIYQANGNASSFDAYGVFVWDLTKQYGDVLRGDQCTSADAAGLPMAALIPTADEVAAGVVPHAIRFILPNEKMKKGTALHGYFVRPATHAGGPTSTNPDAPPYGVRFRLKSSFSETGFSAGAKVILQAMKKYGMILSDGGNIALTFADDRLSAAKWSNLGITAQTFNGIGVSNFEVVDLGAEIANTFDCVRAP